MAEKIIGERYLTDGGPVIIRTVERDGSFTALAQCPVVVRYDKDGNASVNAKPFDIPSTNLRDVRYVTTVTAFNTTTGSVTRNTKDEN